MWSYGLDLTSIRLTVVKVVVSRDVEAEAESGLFSVEAEARKTCRFHIGYLT